MQPGDGSRGRTSREGVAGPGAVERRDCSHSRDRLGDQPETSRNLGLGLQGVLDDPHVSGPQRKER